MIDLNKIIENRTQRIMIITQKIVKKEIKKLKKDIIKQLKEF